MKPFCELYLRITQSRVWQIQDNQIKELFKTNTKLNLKSALNDSFLFVLSDNCL